MSLADPRLTRATATAAGAVFVSEPFPFEQI